MNFSPHCNKFTFTRVDSALSTLTLRKKKSGAVSNILKTQPPKDPTNQPLDVWYAQSLIEDRLVEKDTHSEDKEKQEYLVPLYMYYSNVCFHKK